MIKPDDFPKPMVDLLHSKFGYFVKIERLSGIAGSGSSTYKLECVGDSVVVKSSASPRERLFYERVAEDLRQNGVHIAQVYWSGIDSRHNNWIAIEDVPGAFPQEQWKNNPEQLQLLCNLHSCTSEHLAVDNEDVWYCPKWDGALTELALSWFVGTTQMNEIQSLLLNAQELCQIIFVPNCWLSGDPNPTNWRVRNNGELVMIDWERFCQGSPAIDLAITMPNLGTEDLSLELGIARNYRRFWSEKSEDILPSEAELAFQIRLSKIWTVVEFIANAARNSKDDYPQETIQYIVRELPNYLRMLS